MSNALLQKSPVLGDFDQRRLNESQDQVEERVGQFEEPGPDFSFLQEFDCEIDYDFTSFPVEGEVAVHVADPKHSPIRLGYRSGAETMEVIDWGLTVPLEQIGDLPRLIGRRFLDLYSKAVTGSLHEEEREWLRKVSDQMDYHAFAAARKLPRYREATLVRKSPSLRLQFIDDRDVTLDPHLAPKLIAVEPGDRFGAWFKLDGNGKVTDIEHVLFLPALEDVLGQMPPTSAGIDLPGSLAELLPEGK